MFPYFRIPFCTLLLGSFAIGNEGNQEFMDRASEAVRDLTMSQRRLSTRIARLEGVHPRHNLTYREAVSRCTILGLDELRRLRLGTFLGPVWTSGKLDNTGEFQISGERLSHKIFCGQRAPTNGTGMDRATTCLVAHAYVNRSAKTIRQPYCLAFRHCEGMAHCLPYRVENAVREEVGGRRFKIKALTAAIRLLREAKQRAKSELDGNA